MKPVQVASLALISLCSTSAMSMGQITQQGGGYLFRMKFFPKQVINYVMKTATMVNSKSIATGDTIIPYKIETKSVDNGIATMLVSYGPLTRNGTTEDGVARRLAKMDSRGHYTGGTNESAFDNMILPEKPLKVGDTITLEQGKIVSTTKVVVVGTYTFRGIINLAGVKVADFEVSLRTDEFETGPGLTKATLTGKGHTYLDVIDGQPVKSEIRQVLKTTPGPKSPKNEVAETLTNTILLLRK